MHPTLSVFVMAALPTVANSQSLNGVKQLHREYLRQAMAKLRLLGQTTDMGISADWDGSISAGEQR